jgi:hypothetical protein
MEDNWEYIYMAQHQWIFGQNFLFFGPNNRENLRQMQWVFVVQIC